MDNQLSVIGPDLASVPDPMRFIKEMGTIIAQSQMMGPGISTVQQGQVLALECLQQRTTPLSLARRYNFIFGKMSERADATLGMFRLRGGWHDIIERSPDAATIALYRRQPDGSVGRWEFSFSWDEAKGEPVIYDGKPKDIMPLIVAGKLDKLKIKDKYATPRSRMQMLWSRVVTDGIRAVMPEIIFGKYSEGEVADAAGVDSPATAIEESSNDDVQVVDVVPAKRGPGRPRKPRPEAVVAESIPAAATEIQIEDNTEEGYCTSEQTKQIVQYYIDLQIPHATQQKFLDHFGARALRSLRYSQAEILINKLKAKAEEPRPQDESAETAAAPPATEEPKPQGEVEQHEAAVDTASPAQPDPDATGLPMDGPCTQTQIDEFRKAFALCSQVDPDTHKKVVAKLKSHGIAKASHLCMADMEQLILALNAKNLAAFINSTLSTPRPTQ